MTQPSPSSRTSASEGGPRCKALALSGQALPKVSMGMVFLAILLIYVGLCLQAVIRV